MFTDAEVIKADLIGQPDRLKQIALRLGGAAQLTRRRIALHVAKAVNPQFHHSLLASGARNFPSRRWYKFVT